MGVANGPLSGLNVVDLSALGPGPFASMMLADYGANVIAIARPSRMVFDPSTGLARGKVTLELDLKNDQSLALVKRLISGADIVLESARPGAMERLGLGPEAMIAVNPRLIYCRLTGWGQTGPYARRAGHDINYLAISGALGVTGLDRPIAPPALFGDIANGSSMAVIGILLAVVERARTGRGQVVDAAIVDGAAYGLSAIFGELSAGFFSGTLGDHVLSGSAPFYGVYRCADGQWYSVGAIEPQFYAAFLTLLDLDDVAPAPEAQWDRTLWHDLAARIAERFATRTRDEWEVLFGKVDACGAPVLALSELASDPHLAARATVTRLKTGAFAAAAAPRLGHTETHTSQDSSRLPHLRELLQKFGLNAADIASADACGLLTPQA